MGELSVFSLTTVTLQYVVDSVTEKRHGLFNNVGAVVALAQRRDVVAAAFRNHCVTLYDASDAETTLTSTRHVDISGELQSTGLVRDVIKPFLY